MASNNPVPVAASQEHAQFTRAINTELAGEALELPSFPDVALRVRKALGNPDVAVDDVVRMVSAEPSLAVRLLQLSNSVALNPGGQRITALRVAITRIGFNLARSATIAFAMSQMRRAEAWRGLETHFHDIWEQSAHLAAMSHAVAKRARGVVADQSMLAGMLHAVGRLFVLTRLSRFPSLLNSPAQYEEIQREWHARAARAILTRWELSAEIVAAACDHELAGDDKRTGAADLCDVLFAARHFVALPTSAPAPEPAAFALPPFVRLGLTPTISADVQAASATEIASLRAALLD
jgi:HD-like signal output (HDOD) protein